MSTSKYQQNEDIKIEIDKLIPFLNYEFDQFEKGKKFEDMVDDVRSNGICTPIIVRPYKDGRYEILNGHYRVAAAKKNNLTMVPVNIINVSDKEALKNISDINPIGLWEKYGIDVTDKHYKNSDGYKNMENARVVYEEGPNMALDEYIERFLLTEEERKDYYESIYDLGNSYKLNECECEYDAIAREIIRVSGKTDQWKNASSYLGEKVAAETYKQEENALVNNILRQIKDYGRQIKKYLNIDMDSFDYCMIQNKQERAKMLYFVYMLRNRDFKKINVLQCLSKPSMENVDNSFYGWETNNGKYINFIKCAVGKEITINAKKEIIAAVRNIVDKWGSFVGGIRLQMESSIGQDDYYAVKIKTLESVMSEELICEEHLDKDRIIKSSPLEIFFLRLIQNEYMGQMNDLLMLFALQSNIEYNVPEKYINRLRELETKYISKEDLEIYFHADNVRKIAELVYLKQEIGKEERKKIVRCKKKVLRFWEFNLLYNNNSEDDFTELLVISCLQEILLSKKGEKFNYKYFGYEGDRNGRRDIRSVQTALANDEHTCDALQIYWIHRVVNRSYANVGRSVFIKNFRKLERVQCSILAKILHCDTIKEMLNMDAFYIGKMKELWEGK